MVVCPPHRLASLFVCFFVQALKENLRMYVPGKIYIRKIKNSCDIELSHIEIVSIGSLVSLSICYRIRSRFSFDIPTLKIDSNTAKTIWFVRLFTLPPAHPNPLHNTRVGLASVLWRGAMKNRTYGIPRNLYIYRFYSQYLAVFTMPPHNGMGGMVWISWYTKVGTYVCFSCTLFRYEIECNFVRVYVWYMYIYIPAITKVTVPVPIAEYTCFLSPVPAPTYIPPFSRNLGSRSCFYWSCSEGCDVFFSTFLHCSGCFCFLLLFLVLASVPILHS